MTRVADERLDLVFRALGDPTRRAMLRILAGGDQTVGQLAAPFAMSLAGASKHVKVLQGAGLVRQEARGRNHICRLEPQALAAADEWLSFYREFWTARLDALEERLRSTPRGDDDRSAG